MKNKKLKIVALLFVSTGYIGIMMHFFLKYEAADVWLYGGLLNATIAMLMVPAIMNPLE